MSAHLLIVIHRTSLKVVDAMITSQGPGQMSVMPQPDSIYAELYSFEEPFPADRTKWTNQFNKERISVLRFLDNEYCPYKFVIPLLAKRWRAEHMALFQGRMEALKGNPDAACLVSKLNESLELEMKLYWDFLIEGAA